MRKNTALLLLLTMGLTPSFSGCAFKGSSLPSAARQAVTPAATVREAVIPTAGEVSAGDPQIQRPRFGRYNIHKRHGLGGWEGGPSPGSERELLRGLSRSE